MRYSESLDEFKDVLAEDGSDKLIILKELERDYTDSGQKNAIGAEVSIPNIEIKKKWLEKITSESDDSGKIPIAKLRIAMAGFHQLGQEELTRFAISPYFEYIPKFVNKVQRVSAKFYETDVPQPI